MSLSSVVIPITSPTSGHTFTTGHINGEDFILFENGSDPSVIKPDLIQRLCNRRTGIGATGVILFAPCIDNPEIWAIHYWDFRGQRRVAPIHSVQLVAHYLLVQGDVLLSKDKNFRCRTDSGELHLQPSDAGWTVDVGEWSYVFAEEAERQGADCLVMAHGIADPRPGLNIRVAGEQHTVVALGNDEDLNLIELFSPPQKDPPQDSPSTTVFVVPGEPLVTAGMGNLRVRIHHPIQGEQHSAALPVVAAALAVRRWAGVQSTDNWLVDTLGGIVRVDLMDLGHPEHSGLLVTAAPQLIQTGVLS